VTKNEGEEQKGTKTARAKSVRPQGKGEREKTALALVGAITTQNKKKAYGKPKQ